VWFASPWPIRLPDLVQPRVSLPIPGYTPVKPGNVGTSGAPLTTIVMEQAMVGTKITCGSPFPGYYSVVRWFPLPSFSRNQALHASPFRHATRPRGSLVGPCRLFLVVSPLMPTRAERAEQALPALTQTAAHAAAQASRTASTNSLPFVSSYPIQRRAHAFLHLSRPHHAYSACCKQVDCVMCYPHFRWFPLAESLPGNASALWHIPRGEP
jgi:hypothetical protein